MTKEYAKLDDHVRMVFENCPDLGEEKAWGAFLELSRLFCSWGDLIIRKLMAYIEAQINGVDRDDLLAEVMLLTEHVELTSYEELESDVWSIGIDPELKGGLQVYFRLKEYPTSKVYLEMNPFGFISIPRCSITANLNS